MKQEYTNVYQGDDEQKEDVHNQTGENKQGRKSRVLTRTNYQPRGCDEWVRLNKT